eukprot:595602-Pyramimonas_sp.AAC.1
MGPSRNSQNGNGFGWSQHPEHPDSDAFVVLSLGVGTSRAHSYHDPLNTMYPESNNNTTNCWGSCAVTDTWLRSWKHRRGLQWPRLRGYGAGTFHADAGNALVATPGNI